MTELYAVIHREITEMHEFFVGWFNGTLARSSLETLFLPRLAERVHYILPGGMRLEREGLISMLNSGYASNPDFRITVSDIELHHDFGDHLLVTYTERQQGAKRSQPPENLRATTAILSKPPDIRWWHIHETWLPESVPAPRSSP